jgi:hypothetical protein
LELPHFLLAILYFAAGTLVGSFAVSLRLTSRNRQLKAEKKRATLLEHEINALHTQTGMPAHTHL